MELVDLKRRKYFLQILFREKAKDRPYLLFFLDILLQISSFSKYICQSIYAVNSHENKGRTFVQISPNILIIAFKSGVVKLPTLGTFFTSIFCL